jgi:hypothetical protein
MKTLVSHSIPKSFLFTTILTLGLAFGSMVWATDPPTQGIATQIQNYTTTGDIYESAAAADLTSMLVSVNTAISEGDNVGAQSLLAGFVHAVQGLEGKLISPAAASSLIDAANALSMSL